MKKYGKKMAFLVAVMVMALCLAACGKNSKKDNKTKPTATVTPTATDTPTPTPQTEEKTGLTVNMYTVGTLYAPEYPYYQSLIEMKKSHPEIPLEWTTESRYETDLEADIYLILPDELKAFTDRGLAYKLDSAYETYADALSKDICHDATVDGSLYGIPVSLSAYGVFANKELLASAGCPQAPKNLDELMECCKKLAAAGITPFVFYRYEDSNLPREYYNFFTWIMMNTCDMSKGRLFRDENGNVQPGLADAVNRFTEMKTKGYIREETGYDMMKAFLSGKCAFYFGPLNEADSQFDDMMSDGKICVCSMPAENDANTWTVMGKPHILLVVSSKTKNPESAAKYAFELAQSFDRNVYLCTRNATAPTWEFPAWKITYDDSKIGAERKNLANRLQQTELKYDYVWEKDWDIVFSFYAEKLFKGLVDGDQLYRLLGGK